MISSQRNERSNNLNNEWQNFICLFYITYIKILCIKVKFNINSRFILRDMVLTGLMLKISFELSTTLFFQVFVIKLLLLLFWNIDIATQFVSLFGNVNGDFINKRMSDLAINRDKELIQFSRNVIPFLVFVRLHQQV